MIQTNCLLLPCFVCFLPFLLQVRFSKGSQASVPDKSELSMDHDLGFTVRHSNMHPPITPEERQKNLLSKPTATPCQDGRRSHTVIVTFRFLSWQLISKSRADDPL